MLHGDEQAGPRENRLKLIKVYLGLSVESVFIKLTNETNQKLRHTDG